MVLEGLIIGILIGKLRGGKFKRLANFVLRSSFLLFVALGIQLSTSIMISLGNEFASHYRLFLYIFAYGLVFIVLFINLGRRSLWFVLIGTIANFGAVVLNQGSMPVDLGLLESRGFVNRLESIQMGQLSNYIPLEEAYFLTTYLGKRLSLPAWYPIQQIFTPGDVLIALGLILFVQGVMQSNVQRRTIQMLRFDNKGRI